MHLRKVALVFGIGFVLLMSPIAGLAQGNTGRILGNISDATGALIPGATVTVTDVERGTTRTVITDESGACQRVRGGGLEAKASSAPLQRRGA